MKSFVLVAVYSLKSYLRSWFFLLWSGSICILVYSLNKVTFFEFEDRGLLVEEFFVSTLLFSAFVQSIVFQIRQSASMRSAGGWGLLLGTGVPGVAIPPGVLGGFLLSQVLAGGASTGALLASQWQLGRETSSTLGNLLLLALAKIILIGASHTTLSFVFSRTWAIVGMLGVYVVGQLSDAVYAGIGRTWGDVVYTLIPDLQPLGLAERHGGLPSCWSALLYAAAYSGLCITVAALGVSRESAMSSS